MSLDVFKKIADDVKRDFGSVKCLALTTGSEPLTNPGIADMVAYARDSGIAETIELYTNGSLLSEKMSSNLINAGLSRIRISVNALQDEDFQKYSGIKFSFDTYVKNIRYLYENRGSMEVYVKTLNYMVKSDERKKRFFDVFEPISDTIGIQALVKTTTEIDFEKVAGSDFNFSETVSMVKLRENVSVCPLPFFTLRIDEEGGVYPCCGAPEGVDSSLICLGNVNQKSLGEIWTKASRALQNKMLDGHKNVDGCKDCTSIPHFVSFDEDFLDDKADIIKAKYQCKEI
jgi:radical SAM protein with 4Fe4S-binding SPASM domain